MACCRACQPGHPRPARRYLNALQTNAQHLLRYLAAAVVVNKRRRNVLKELIRVVEQQVPPRPVPGCARRQSCSGCARQSIHGVWGSQNVCFLLR